MSFYKLRIRGTRDSTRDNLRNLSVAVGLGGPHITQTIHIILTSELLLPNEPPYTRTCYFNRNLPTFDKWGPPIRA